MSRPDECKEVMVEMTCTKEEDFCQFQPKSSGVLVGDQLVTMVRLKLYIMQTEAVQQRTCVTTNLVNRFSAKGIA